MVAFVVPVAYTIHVASFYGHYLNRHFIFVADSMVFAPEDVLGFGFLVPWLLMATVFALAGGVAFLIRRTPRGYLVAAIVVFIAVSAVDFALYRVLEKQVLAL